MTPQCWWWANSELLKIIRKPLTNRIKNGKKSAKGQIMVVECKYCDSLSYGSSTESQHGKHQKWCSDINIGLCCNE
jgi:hypothetical protein